MKRGHFTLSKESQFSFQGDASQKDYFNLLKQDLQSLSADEISSNELVFVLDPLLNMDKEDAQKILNSKKENKVKIIGGTTYE